MFVSRLVLGVSISARATCNHWSDFLDRTIVDVRVGAPPLDDTLIIEPESCTASLQLRRLRGFLTFLVSAWLTSYPTHSPDVGGGAAGAGDALKRNVELIFQLLHDGRLVESGCVEAAAAFQLFVAVIQGSGSSEVPLFPGSQYMSWRQAAMSQWPLFGLTAQVLRLEASPFGLEVGDECEVFLEQSTHPIEEAATHTLPASLFLDRPPRAAPHCRLATALALAIVAQGASRNHAVEVAGVAASLLAAVSEAGDAAVVSVALAAAPRAALFILLDQLLACPTQVNVTSKAGRSFELHVFPFREYMSDRIRFFKFCHCGLELFCGEPLEEQVTSMLRGRPASEPLVVVEVGAAFGQCLLPLLLIAPGRVQAVAIEASRDLRQLLAKSLEGIGIRPEFARRVQGPSVSAAAKPWDGSTATIVAAYVAVGEEAHDGSSRDQNVDMFCTPGWRTTCERAPKERSDELVLPLVRERSSARVLTLSEAVGHTHVDLLLVYPQEICSAMERTENPPARCRQRLCSYDQGTMCVYIDCILPG